MSVPLVWRLTDTICVTRDNTSPDTIKASGGMVPDVIEFLAISLVYFSSLECLTSDPIPSFTTLNLSRIFLIGCLFLIVPSHLIP